VTVAIDETGRPLLLLSKLAEHTGNVLERPEASLLMTEPARDGEDALALGRVTILGTCTLVPEEEKAAVRETFLAQRPSAAAYAGFSDFSFYRLEPVALRYVGGFGRMSWVDPDAYRDAVPA
jgi:putative heme iron utilization protein